MGVRLEIGDDYREIRAYSGPEAIATQDAR